MSTLYLVVPYNAWECLKNTNYDTPNYSEISLIILIHLKQIELLSKVKYFRMKILTEDLVGIMQLKEMLK